ncbi:MAG: hypothetical protein AAF543_16210 [Pseudomonadota bacterium]
MSGVMHSHGRKRHGYAVCGLGPAGCGFLLHAIKENAIGDLVDDGLVLIDRSTTPGPGKVGRYRLTGNSLSRAFLDCVDDPKLSWLMQDFCASSPSVVELRTMEQLAPPLDVVGDFLTAVAKRTIDYLSSAYQVPVLLETAVDTIHRQVDGSFLLRLRDGSNSQRFDLVTDNVLCSFGGRQPAKMIEQCEIHPGLRLGDHAERIIPSDEFLMMSDHAVRQSIPLTSGEASDVLVVGGSHSAISTIDRLTEALGPMGLRRIVMLHRDPLRLYYASADEARRDGYAFDDPKDVCPMSGRINRFSGLRYRSFDVARSILETGRTPDQSVEVVSVHLRGLSKEGRATLENSLKRSSAVVTCLGYQANLPRVVDHWDREIMFRNQYGGLDVDACGCALTIDRQSVSGLYVYGIGSRLLKRSEAIGGEPSFRGSADGVWLYHNHGGSVILNALGKAASNGIDRPVRTQRDVDRANYA